MGYNRFPRKSTSPLRAVSIARTVEQPQKELEDFLNAMGRALDRQANVRTITSTRLTFLESNGIHKVLRRYRSEPQAVQRFSYWMSGQLNDYRGKNIDVRINPDKPLVIKGRNNNKLALNVIKDEQIQGEREKAEELLIDKFGELPRLKSFEPHITIGCLATQALSEVEIEHPELLIPEYAVIPQTVALNGLTVFLDGKGLKH